MGAYAQTFSEGSVRRYAVLIVVLTGTGPGSFERLICPIDELARRQQWEVFVQLGYTPFEPKWCRFERFVEKHRLRQMISKAELVVTHGGFGSMRDALSFGKPVVAVPRRVNFGEVQDDHQMELVDELEKKGLVIKVNDVTGLEQAIEEARTFVPGTLPQSMIPQLIGDFINGL
jgi:UDP-N-acetylglucosamine transferase subunit ALG13